MYHSAPSDPCTRLEPPSKSMDTMRIDRTTCLGSFNMLFPLDSYTDYKSHISDATNTPRASSGPTWHASLTTLTRTILSGPQDGLSPVLSASSSGRGRRPPCRHRPRCRLSQSDPCFSRRHLRQSHPEVRHLGRAVHYLQPLRHHLHALRRRLILREPEPRRWACRQRSHGRQRSAAIGYPHPQPGRE